MVPGAPAAWAEVHRRFGRLAFEELFEPAIAYARDGYAVMPNLAAMLADSMASFAPYRGKKIFQHLFDTFFPHDQAPKAGDILKLPELAKSLEILRDSHCRALYDGELADAIDAWSRETGSGPTQSIRRTVVTMSGKCRPTAMAWSSSWPWILPVGLLSVNGMMLNRSTARLKL